MINNMLDTAASLKATKQINKTQRINTHTHTDRQTTTSKHATV